MIVVVTIVILFANVLTILLSIFYHKRYHKKFKEWPQVSVLLAVRDEEKVLLRCLDSLVNLDYPTDKLQILIGNDDSQDNSWEIIESFQQKYPFVKALNITQQVGVQYGKANVLAQLASEAIGDYYLITDADMYLPATWVKGMLSPMYNGAGLAIGVTHVENDKMQDMDWLFSLGIVKVVTDLNLPVTGMGNNMIVSKTAYQAVGGYECLPFSITEDFELFKHIIKKGYTCEHIFQKEILGKTLSINGFFNLLNQRKRWMKGALGLPWYMICLLLFQVCFYFLIVVLLLKEPWLASLLVGIKIVLQSIFLGIIRLRLGLPLRLFYIFAYEGYSFVVAVSSTLYFLLPIKLKWKRRVY